VEYAPCHVCGELTSEYSNAVCNFCVRVYHLALRNDIPAKDCGQVWINEEHLALEFACNACITEFQSARVPQRLDAPATYSTDASSPQTEAASRRRYTRREGMTASALVRGKRKAMRR
jgi:hypothetical protein